MPETSTAAFASTGTWTEAEIRQQPACWLRSLNNIDNIRSTIDSFLTPATQKRPANCPDRSRHLRLYRRDHRALAVAPYRKKFQRGPNDRSGHKPHGLL